MEPFEYANASKVTDRLWVGGDLDMVDEALAARQLRELRENGLTHVVDVRIEWSDEEFVRDAEPRVAYLWNGIDDDGQQVPAQWFEAAVSWVLDALDDPESVVLTHCHMGVNRGPSLGFAVLLALGWDPVDAMSAIREARPVAHVFYAEDALAWHHGRLGSSADALERDLDRLAVWRQENPLDVAHVIAGVRAAEQRTAEDPLG